MDTTKTYYFSWVRKGISNRITEKDLLGVIKDDSALARKRPIISITAEYEVTPYSFDEDENVETLSRSYSKNINLISAGDITTVNANAVQKVVPQENSIGFPIQFFPYVEFWEPDFLWRYTPAANNEDRLRSWLALVVCEKSLCNFMKQPSGISYVTFNLNNNQQYEQVFPYPEDFWKCAHAQGFSKETPELSRLIALRATPELKEDSEYFAFLIPSFETGRLRGLGYGDEELKDVVAQAHSWEKSLDEQRKTHTKRPLDFPVYYHWKFTTGGDSFDGLVEKLTIVETSDANINVDVTEMGEGLDYNVLSTIPERNVIGMPAATKTLKHIEHRPFPDNSGNSDEKEIYGRIKELVSQNPVFLDNESLISGTAEGETPGDDDPWVVPPAYGANHIMATTVDETKNKNNNTPWFSELNLDVHYRAAAGLGKRTVQIHQEEFVNRAWKQVEAVQALNLELYKRLMSVKTNKSLFNKTFSNLGYNGTNDNYIANLMQYFSSMKFAAVHDKNGETVSLSEIMKDKQIPQAFASATFQHLTDNLTKLIDGMDSTSVMENIADKQIFKMKEHSFYDLPDFKQIKQTKDDILILFENSIINFYLADFITLDKSNTISQSNNSGVVTQNKYVIRQKPLNLIDFINYSDVYKANRIPKNHLKFYHDFLEKGKNKFIHQEETDLVYELINEFIKKEHTKTSFFGYALNDNELPKGLSTKPDDNYKYLSSITISYYDENKNFINEPVNNYIKKQLETLKANIVGIEDELYSSMFGDEYFITRVGGEKGLYFISKQKLLDKYLKNEASLKKSLYSYIHIYNEIIETLHHPAFDSYLNKNFKLTITKMKFEGYAGVPEYYDEVYSLADCFHPCYYDRRSTMYDRNKVNPEKWNNYDENKKEILDFLIKIPDYIILDLSQFPDNYIQKFDAISDYVHFLKHSEEEKTSPYLRMWMQLDSKVSELEVKFKKLQDEKGTKTPVIKNEKEIEKDAKQLHGGFEDSETWERMRKVAETYYTEFFADNESGQALREKYIDELLHSKYPVLAYPIFPEPVYHYLKMFSEKFILPEIDALPPESIAAFKSNTAFVEAYLCGMNTEMGRELLWREYPTDQRGSYFRKFWDSETDAQSIRNEDFFDIKPVHAWQGNLGDNHAEAKTGLLLFAIKGKLLLQFPSTRIFLHRATGNRTKKTIDFDPNANVVNEGVILPVIQAYIKDDVYIVGFKKEFEDLIGEPQNNDFGYILTFEEDVQDLNFEYNTEEKEDLKNVNNAADAAKILKNDPTLFGKHLSLFVI